jgi:hypothetical protein
MQHVESIVRPLRATQRRKLRMRRELLAHLQSALAEESPHHPTESAALDAAKSRLGTPADLTAQLQRSVPFLERLLLAHFPAPRALTRWEALTAAKWAPYTSLQQTLIILATLGTTLLLLLAPIYFLHENQRSAFFALQSTNPSLYYLICLLLFLLLTNFPLLTISLAEKLISSRLPWLHLLTTTTLAAAWLLVVHSLIAQQPLTPNSLITSLLTALALTTTQGLLTRAITGLPNPYHEWQQLQLAQ